MVREVMEETGIAVNSAALPSPVWTRDAAFLWEGTVERHIERFFLIRVDARDVDATRFERSATGMIRAHRWWTVDEILNSTAVFAPARLGVLLAPLLRGEMPASPVAVGE